MKIYSRGKVKKHKSKLNRNFHHFSVDLRGCCVPFNIFITCLIHLFNLTPTWCWEFSSFFSNGAIKRRRCVRFELKMYLLYIWTYWNWYFTFVRRIWCRFFSWFNNLLKSRSKMNFTNFANCFSRKVRRIIFEQNRLVWIWNLQLSILTGVAQAS